MKYDLDMDISVVYECSNEILKYTDSKSDYTSIINELIKEVNNLKDFWISQSEEKTANKLIESLNELRNLQTRINDTASVARMIAESRNEVEKKIIKIIHE